MGIYFADQLDYVKYYYKKDDIPGNFNPNLYTIPKMNESFSIVISEVYYDKSQIENNL